MNTIEFLKKVKQTPEKLEFSELMDVIDKEYHFKPSAFRNGNLDNTETENMGSCKILSFGQLHGLSADETLACFGIYFREDVLQNPNGDDHQNIRNFMQTGWDGVLFSQNALVAKS